ncbi:hypothetical protein HYQ44_015065 [Verticillium longisporum]|nr:hypothetical protein HYQ44_015065 [Verticillium longisporum]
MSRRKSSKRRRDDHDREAELKAMSNFVPVRPSAEAWTAGRPMKKDSKRVRTGGRGSGAVSEVSLPIPDSIHSSMSSDSEHASYRISALEALAPRPTLRYATHPRWAPGNSTDPTRSTSQRNKLAERANLPEATLKSHKRIDSLADDLGASDLRELMERDNRRRERKRQREQEHTERRLVRRAEKQREAEAEASKSGTPPPQNLERGVMGRDVVGLGIDTTSAVVTSSRRRSSDASFKRKTPSPEQGHASPERDTTAEEALDTQNEPFSHFHRTTSIPLETALESGKEVEAPATPPPETIKRANSIQKKKLGIQQPRQVELLISIQMGITCQSPELRALILLKHLTRGNAGCYSSTRSRPDALGTTSTGDISHIAGVDTPSCRRLHPHQDELRRS